MVTEQVDAPAEEAVSSGQTNAARDAALAAVAELRKSADDPGTLRLSNGIVLALKCPPQELITEAAAKVPKPAVPMSFNESKGREEENPLDPDYIAAMKQWQTTQYLAGGDVALLMGTSCMSVPDGYFRPEEDDWIEYLEILGNLDPVPPMRGDRVPPKRYWAWLRLYALRTYEDFAAATYGALMLTSLSEEDVALAVASFRGNAGRRADRGGSDEDQRADGDPIPPALPGIREQAGGEGGGAVLADTVAAMAPAPEA